MSEESKSVRTKPPLVTKSHGDGTVAGGGEHEIPEKLTVVMLAEYPDSVAVTATESPVTSGGANVPDTIFAKAPLVSEVTLSGGVVAFTVGVDGVTASD